MTKKVLAIDDSKTLRMIIGKHLTPFGVEVFEAENGEQGIAKARETSPDVILLDYNMPVMDGYHTLTELKGDPALKAIPVVMLTTETVKETVLRLMKLGLKDYIAKPFTRELLLSKLNPILGLFEGDLDGDAQAGDAAEGGKPTVLAVDDKANILDMLKEHLGEQFNVTTADSGKAGQAAVVKNRFTYLFLDLSMPDVGGFEVLQQYLESKKNGADVRKVVAMTLRTAQADIEKAMKAGISAFLYKPFSREDSAKAVEKLLSQQKGENGGGKGVFLAKEGDVRVLDLPADKDPQYAAVAGALTSNVRKEIDEMAEEGLSRLVIKVGPGFLSDSKVTRKFIDLVEHTVRLSLTVRFVAETEQAQSALKQFAETASLPTDASLELALNSMG